LYFPEELIGEGDAEVCEIALDIFVGLFEGGDHVAKIIDQGGVCLRHVNLALVPSEELDLDVAEEVEAIHHFVVETVHCDFEIDLVDPD
jgi:hypothetical protein